ncbi:MAG TPA: DNA polymerase III subunit gamma/tau [Oceanithermus profundus]|uniref:DNA polymerase III subunit gamma/tau n=1 Tax=Oceanithermus profundus TaxID=187137 RepID=A0A7C4VC79_9DEIN|nr:DNA polymerase III subunit gamma/tau [Oceanithermus profundus]
MGALYRRARPATFDAVVGQEHVKDVLKSAIKSGRLAHAYLFSGPRGVGKTTTARLIAMSVGCQAAPEDRPCGECENCRMVREDRHPDVVEIDAASNNSVEDVRELRERILLAPLVAPKKVIILDEAHMMSKSAFNALLKTLEEPPEHVIFIFATTEPERMPATILSRTQHFRFHRLTEEQIAGKLAAVLEAEGRTAEPEALRLIARMSGGAMRDAESILDRLLTLEADPITRAVAEEALGLPPAERVAQIAAALDAGEVDRAVTEAKRLFSEGYAARTLTEQLAQALQAGLYARLGLGEGPELAAEPERLIAALTALDEHTEKLIRREDPFTLELGLLRVYAALHAAPAAPAAPPASGTRRPEPRKATPAAKTPEPARPAASPEPAPAAGETTTGEDAAPAAAASVDLTAAWRQVLKEVGVKVRAFLLEATPHLEDDALVLVYDEGHRFHHDRAREQQTVIEEAVRGVLGRGVRFELGKKNARLSPEPAPPPVAPPEEAAPPAEPPPAQPAAPEPEPEPTPPGPKAQARPAQRSAARKRRTRKAAEPPEPRFDRIELLDDPRFQKLQGLFKARLREVWSEASAGGENPEDEAPDAP